MNYKKLVSAAVGIAVLATSLATSAVSALSTASMTLSGTTNSTGNFSVTVYENTGSDTVTTAYVELAFSQAVSGVSYDYSVGPFKSATPSGAHATTTEVSGSNPVATVSFKLANPGSVTATVSSNSFLKHAVRDANGYTIDSETFNVNRGSAAFTYSAPVVSTPAPTTGGRGGDTPAASTTPKASTSTTKTATTNSTTAATDESKAQVEGDSTTAATDTKKKDAKSDNKDSKKDDAKKTSSKSGFWLTVLAILVAIAGFILGRRAVAAKTAAKARAAEKAAAVAAAAKAAEKKTAKASNKKNTKKAKK